MRVLATLCTGTFVVFLVAMGFDLVLKGAGGFAPEYLLGEVSDAGRAGGIAPVLVSTLALLALSLLIAGPISLAGAVLCAEVWIKRPALSHFARRSFDLMVSVPSVAVGLVGWTVFSGGLGLSFSLFSGALTLSLMLVPVMTVAFLNGLDAVPGSLRAEGLALGLQRSQVLFRLLLPAARPALLAGVVLAVGRATAETAALILTSGISTRMPQGVFDPGATLAVHVYHMARNVPGGEAAAYRAALVLFVINGALHTALASLRKGGRS